MPGEAARPAGAAASDHAPPQPHAQPVAPSTPSGDADPVDHAAMGHTMPDARAHAPQAGHAPARSAGDLPADAAPRDPVPVPTEADVAAAFPVLDHHAMDHASQTSAMLLVERLEAWDADVGTGQAWEVGGWVGGDVHRLWLRSEGERSGGRTGSADLELLYGRGVTPWWDVVVGARHEIQPDGRTWAAFGVQGLAPYFVEVSATGYVGSGGQAQARLEAEYEILLTNRLILQPLVEATFSLEDEPARRLGSGLNTVETGLRLRYEISRRFAPYVGVVHERRFGETADLVDAAGGHVRDTRVVAGVRIWF
ncbi:copper resistance protein B [Luteimonas cellulosilyticus]|uniref:copper resistance protein B n=1 Tax=Luteimonas cellulosilyticus TaxID=2683586 RepID=UPI001F23362A|nr:copper resistance protein B [Luteimonas cellulosilyticus]